MDTTNKIVLVVLIILALVFAVVVFASTSIKYTHTFKLRPGTYCLTNGYDITGNKLKVTVKLVDGECVDAGDTIII